MARAKQGGGDVSPLSELSPVGLSDGDFFMRGVQPFPFSYKPIDFSYKPIDFSYKPIDYLLL